LQADDILKNKLLPPELQDKAGLIKKDKKGEDAGPELKATTKFEFEAEKLYKDFKEETTEGDYKYAISKWKINGGKNAVQVREIGITG